MQKKVPDREGQCNLGELCTKDTDTGKSHLLLLRTSSASAVHMFPNSDELREDTDDALRLLMVSLARDRSLASIIRLPLTEVSPCRARRECKASNCAIWTL